MDDDEFLDAFRCGTLTDLPHLNHVRVVYLVTRRQGSDDAISLARRGLRALADAAGVPDKYHETRTVAWARIIADRTIAAPGRSFAEFMELHPELRRKELLGDYYSTELLTSPRARAEFVPPDLRPIP